MVNRRVILLFSPHIPSQCTSTNILNTKILKHLVKYSIKTLIFFFLNYKMKRLSSLEYIAKISSELIIINKSLSIFIIANDEKRS